MHYPPTALPNQDVILLLYVTNHIKMTQGIAVLFLIKEHWFSDFIYIYVVSNPCVVTAFSFIQLFLY